jgi:hypothetical protein
LRPNRQEGAFTSSINHFAHTAVPGELLLSPYGPLTTPL